MEKARLAGYENYSRNRPKLETILSRCNPVHAARDFWKRDVPHLSFVFRRIPATLGIPTGNPPFWRKGKGKFRDEFLRKVLRREFDSRRGYMC